MVMNLVGGMDMSAPKFQPIELLNPTAEDQKNAKPHSEKPKFFDLFFRLSAQPNQEWSRIFSDVWGKRMKSSPSAMRALAYVKGRQLGITCELEHLSEHFKNMQSDVAATNQRYQTDLDKKANVEAEAKRKEEGTKSAQQQSLNDAFKKLIGS
jgi:hypothetical protein